MILLRIKGYDRHVLSMPSTQRYQNMEPYPYPFQKRINEPEPQMRSRVLVFIYVLQCLFQLQ